MALAPGSSLTEPESAELMLSGPGLFRWGCAGESLGDIVKMQNPVSRSEVGSKVLGF